MRNFRQQGYTVTLTAPFALTSGQGAVVGQLFGVAVDDIANGAIGEFITVGVFDITKKSGDTFAQGAKVYWDNTNKYITSTATSNYAVGYALVAAVGGDATVRVLLNGGSYTATF